MKKILLYLLPVFFCNALSAQIFAPTIGWQKCLGGTGSDVANVIMPTLDSNYILVGTTESANGDIAMNHGSGTGDCWVTKLSPTGSIIWQKSLGGTQGEVGISVRQTADTGFIIAAYSLSNNGDVDTNRGVYDAWVVKLSPTGDIQWKKTYGGTSYDVPLSIQQTTDGGYIMAGWSKSNNGDVSGNHGDEDCWVVKLSPVGAIQWQKSLGGTGEDHATCITQTPDGGYLMSGFVKSNDGDVSGNHGGDDMWVVKLSSTGTVQWKKCLGGTGNDKNGDHAYSGTVLVAKGGGYVLSGWSNSTNGDVTGNHGSYDYWIVKLNDTGKILWQRSMGGSGDDEANDIRQTADSGYIVTGISNSNDGDVSGNHGLFDIWVVKLNDTGAIEWQNSYGGPGTEMGLSIHETWDSGYITTGYTNASGGQVSGAHGNYDIWVLKLNKPVINSIADVQAEQFRIVPNPVLDHFRIEGLKDPGYIRVYNTMGSLVLGRSASGDIFLPGLAAGIYTVSIFSRDGVLQGHAQLLKR